MSVPICNHFYAREDNSAEIKTFRRGIPISRPPIKTLLPRGTKFCRKKTGVLAAAYSKGFVILACIVFVGLKSVTDRQTPMMRVKTLSPITTMTKKL